MRKNGKRPGRPLARFGGESIMPEQDAVNPFTDVHSIIGILLGLFGTALSFIGITSGEVTAILRNDAEGASVVALLLLLGVLAATLTVVTSNSRDDAQPVASPLELMTIILLFLGAGLIVIYFIPVGTQKSWVLGLGCVVSACAFVSTLLLAALSLGVSQSGSAGDTPSPRGFWKHLLVRSLPVKVVLIVVSAILIAMSMYTAMRLEARSQLQTEVQVTASVSESDSLATLSVHVTAAKLRNDSWVHLQVYDAKNRPIASGSISPDVNGNVDNTLAIPIQPGKYDQISIQTSTCTAPRTDTIKPLANAATSDCGNAPSQLTITDPAPTPAPTGT
jgi:hypothetical protein